MSKRFAGPREGSASHCTVQHQSYLKQYLVLASGRKYGLAEAPRAQPRPL